MRRHDLFAFLVIFLGALLAACASPDGPPFELQPATAGKAVVYAFRTASIVGGGNTDLVTVNERFIGRLTSGSYAVYEADPGPLSIARKAGSIFSGEGETGGWGLGAVIGAIDGYIEVVALEAEAGEIYFVRFPHGELVPNQQALTMMDGLENVTPAAK